MRMLQRAKAFFFTIVTGAVSAAPAFADTPGHAAGPRNWQMGFRDAASLTMERITEFHNLLLIIISLIALFVLVLLLYVMYRFSEKRNPTPSKTTHNTLLEVLWTTIPVIILVVVAIPSFKLLYFTDRIEEAEMTIKAIGRQWYWSYEYPDYENFTFDATLVDEEDLEEGQKRLLETDNYVVLPVDTRIRILITASDVLHSFALPALGIKLDGVPGRLNETWVQITREGTYYGQCSEICGTGHSYMPIAVKAVSKEAFAEWVEEAKVEFARVEPPAAQPRLAQAPQAQ
jgi:cytochrome c oxidase subunit II